jgi:DNA invertase Pin-like site-specific DNA recombinase
MGKIPPNRKLTMEQAEDIRKMFISGTNASTIAKMFNVSDAIISSIIKGYTYRNKENS